MSNKSYKQISSERRDFRAAKDDLKEKTLHKTKNTKKWCKGKEGKEHILKCFSFNELKRGINSDNFRTEKWRILICTACGKELDHYYPFSDQKSIPDWVEF